MKFQHLPLIALLLFSSLAQAAQKDNSPEKKAAAASITTTTIAKQEKEIAQHPQSIRQQELLLPATLPAVLHDLIKDYIFGEKGETFLSILYRQVAQLGIYGEYCCTKFTNNENLIITGEQDVVKFWDLTGKEIKAIPTTYRWIHTSFDGNAIIIVRLPQKAIQILDTTGKHIAAIKIQHTNIERIALTPQALIMLIYNPREFDDQTIGIWNRATGTCIKQIKNAHNGEHISLIEATPDGNNFISASWGGTAKIWDTLGNHIKTLSGHSDRITSLAISRDGNIIATGSWDHTAKLWDRKTGNCILTINHFSRVNSVHIRHDGRIMTMAGSNGSLRIWDQKKGEYIASLTHGGYHERHAIAISPDGNTFVTRIPYANPLVTRFTATNSEPARVHKFDSNAQQDLYKLSFESLIQLEQLITAWEQRSKHQLNILSADEETFLFSLPVSLQNNFRTHFDVTRTREQYEKSFGPESLRFYK